MNVKYPRRLYTKEWSSRLLQTSAATESSFGVVPLTRCHRVFDPLLKTSGGVFARAVQVITPAHV